MNSKLEQLNLNGAKAIYVNKKTAILAQNFKQTDSRKEIQSNQLIITTGSSLGFLEIQKKAQHGNETGAAEFLGVEVGDKLIISSQ